MPSNTAAWLTTATTNPLEVRSAPYTPPQDHEIIVKNGAVALNPVDWAVQDMGPALFSWLTYPCVLGWDIAGEVVEVGSAVTRFKPGDRAVALALGTNDNKPSEGGFQTYTVVPDHMASPIPKTLAYENAAVIPLGLCTAASGLFQKDSLNLQYPSMSAKPTGETLIIWSGSSSVGSNAIQLAVAAGYEVFSTASPKNFDYVKSLGASQVFDHNSKTIVEDILHALKDKTIAGALSMANGLGGGRSLPEAKAICHSSTYACLDIVAKAKGRKFVAMASFPPENLPPGIGTKFIWASEIKDNEVSKVIFEDFLPEALAAGKFVAAPEPLFAGGKGLESIQAALALQKQGVSAKKVVVCL
jgi:NADPH:quinone reductase-like Zn-dependent oxidoreductase